MRRRAANPPSTRENRPIEIRIIQTQPEHFEALAALQHVMFAGIPVEAYAQAVAAGKLTDPTVTMQLRAGFRLRGLLRHYVSDPRSDDIASLIVRENHACHEKRPDS